MFNSLPLIVVIILSLFLVFYCLDEHKSSILSLIDVDKERVVGIVPEEKPQKVIIAETEVIKEMKHEEAIYVEMLAVDVEKNETIKEHKEVLPTKVEPISETETEESKLSESTKGYALDDLEKMILEELKKGKKD